MKLPRRFFVATGNRGKLREIVPMIEEYFGGDSLGGLRLAIEGRAARAAEETESTFIGNALIKARALARELREEGLEDFCVLSDDSGLDVDALGGRPGVHSARYAGDHVEADAHIRKLLHELEPFPKPEQRTARYHCALALVVARQGEPLAETVTEGLCEGHIGHELKGASGFGYDPVFVVTDSDARSQKLAAGLTMAEIPYAAKNAFSHRRRAFEALVSRL
jgi:XTP/dITP diphosphohydrolase